MRLRCIVRYKATSQSNLVTRLSQTFGTWNTGRRWKKIINKMHTTNQNGNVIALSRYEFYLISFVREKCLQRFYAHNILWLELKDYLLSIFAKTNLLEMQFWMPIPLMNAKFVKFFYFSLSCFEVNNWESYWNTLYRFCYPILAHRYT